MQQATAEQLEFPTASDVCELVAGDPLHARERQAVVDAIRADAAAHFGQVNQNRVREQIPAWVASHVIGATYNALRTRGVIVVAGWTTNTDRRGRNVGKPARLYRWEGE